MFELLHLLTKGSPEYLSSNSPDYLLKQIEDELSENRLLFLGINRFSSSPIWLILVPVSPDSLLLFESDSKKKISREEFLKLFSDVLYQKIWDPWSLMRQEHDVDIWSYALK